MEFCPGIVRTAIANFGELFFERLYRLLNRIHERRQEWLAPIKYGDGEVIRGLYRVRSNTLTTEKLLKAIRKVPDVLLAIPDSVGRIHQEPGTDNPSPPEGEIATAGWFLGSQVYRTVGADDAASFIANQPLTTRATICVIGTGLDTSIDVFQVHRPSNGVWGHSLIGDPNDLTDVLDHGTRVVSQISMVTSADALIAVYAIKAIDDDGRWYASDVIRAVQFVIDEKVRFNQTEGAAGIGFYGMNLSLSLPGNGTDLAILRDKLYEAGSVTGVLPVMAAGDRIGPESPVFNLDESPSANGLASAARCMYQTFAVAATSADGSHLTDSSYYGPQTVQLAAPGSGNRAVGVGGVVMSFSGTSAAAAIVLGAAVELSRRGIPTFEASPPLNYGTHSQSISEEALKGSRLLDFGRGFSSSPGPSYHPILQLDGKMKYFTDLSQIRGVGATDSTACVQGYFGFIERDGLKRFDLTLSGPPPLGNTLVLYNKLSGRDQKKVRVK